MSTSLRLFCFYCCKHSSILEEKYREGLRLWHWETPLIKINIKRKTFFTNPLKQSHSFHYCMCLKFVGIRGRSSLIFLFSLQMSVFLAKHWKSANRRHLQAFSSHCHTTWYWKHHSIMARRFPVSFQHWQLEFCFCKTFLSWFLVVPSKQLRCSSELRSVTRIRSAEATLGWVKH